MGIPFVRPSSVSLACILSSLAELRELERNGVLILCCFSWVDAGSSSTNTLELRFEAISSRVRSMCLMLNTPDGRYREVAGKKNVR